MVNAETSRIDVAYPSAADLHLRISVGACRLLVRPGSEEWWVTGSYRGPAGVFPPRVIQEGGTAHITQEHNLAGIPQLLSGVPTLELALGKAQPYRLTLEVGASDSSFDLGGLPIHRLVVKQGAGKATFDFSAPNPEAMSLLDLSAGAVALEMRSLGNANFTEMKVEGGAASFEFDFGGVLQREAQARISTGVSYVKIGVPGSTAARIVSDSVFGTIELGDGFMKKDGAYWTEAALAARTPLLSIQASINLGALHLYAT